MIPGSNRSHLEQPARLPTLSLWALRVALLAIVGLVFASTASASDYYACDCASGADGQCQAGSDSLGNGTIDNPWRSFDKIRNTHHNASCGDTFNFCKGGAWDLRSSGNSRWMGSSGTGTISSKDCRTDTEGGPGNRSHVVVQSYTPPWGSGDEGRPYFATGSGDMFSTAGTGAQGSNTNRMKGWEVRGLHVECPSCRHDDGSNFVYLAGDGSDFNCGWYTFEDNYLDSMDTAFQFSQNSGRCDHVAISDNVIIDVRTHGMQGGARNTVIQNNLFQGIGCDGVQGRECLLDHPIYFSRTGNHLHANTIIRGNVFRDNHIRTNGVCSGTTIEGEIGDGYVIEDNLFVNTDEDAAHDPGASNWCLAIAPNGDDFVGAPVIQRNVFINFERPMRIYYTRDLTVQNNLAIWRNTNQGFAFIALFDDGSGGDTQNLKVLNNTFHSSGMTGGVTFLTNAGSPSNLTFYNNVLSTDTTGSRAMYGGGSTIENAIVASDGNVAQGPVVWGNNKTLVRWQADNGFDTSLPDPGANPLLVDPTNGKLWPAIGSPLLGSGMTSMAPSHSLSTACDLTAVDAATWRASCGGIVPRGNPTDIGAYQPGDSPAAPAPLPPVLLGD